MSGFIPGELLTWFAPAIVLLLALAGTGFLFRFVVPGLLLGRELGAARRRLAALHDEGNTAPETVAERAMTTPLLAGAWREYAQTLHPQRGTPPVWRATAGAEAFFTEHVLVDTPLKTEFYKHLPGILTGIGILGTFSGLILGLSQFAVSSDANAVRGSLNALIHSVGHAFQVSAAAIALAMLFTWIEKSLVTALYRRVTQLVQLIDGLYEGGSSEEYLARLVQNSEASAQQAARLREALVDAVRQSLDRMAERQGEARADDPERLARAVTQAIADGLREPMQQLAATVARIGIEQGRTLDTRLDESLTRFADLMERRSAAEAEAAARQRQSGDARTEALLGELAMQIGALNETIRNTGTLAQGSASRVAASSQAAGDRIEQGARQIGAACGELAGASREFAAMARRLGEACARIEAAAVSLTAATAREEATLAAHTRLQETLASGLEALRTTVAAARREAGLSADLIARLEAGANQLGIAQRQAEEYLAGINSVLGEAHAAFARNMERTLREGNAQFQSELAEAVEHLKQTIDELGDALDGVVARN